MANGAIGRRSSRSLAYAVALLGGFTLLCFVLSFFASGPLRALAETPLSVRLGVLLLTAGFVALVWQEQAQMSRSAAEQVKASLLDTAIENRMRVVSGLLDDNGRKAAPLPMNDVLSIILACAVDAAGAESGSLDYFEQKGSTDLAVAQTVSTNPARPTKKTGRASVELPLIHDETLVGLLTLLRPRNARQLEPATVAVLERFTTRAARLIQKAAEVNAASASAAYLEATNLVKSRFLTTISHELRTPLTSIIGYSKTLGNHWSRLEEEQKRDFVREIEKQGERMARLVERILEAARVELQGVVIEPVLHDVRTSIQKGLAPFMATDADRIRVALPERPIEAEIDPFVIDQVLSNLVDNALRYTTGSVRISVDAYRSSVTISVSDEGDGIDPKQLNLVLEPLYRIDENIKSGTGLGLHIVRTLVESHGGRGEIRSGATGTHIAIKLPRTAGSRISGKVADPAARAVSAR
ncbi:MAG: sensor histidine kinase [Actinomycetota bacterium]